MTILVIIQELLPLHGIVLRLAVIAFPLVVKDRRNLGHMPVMILTPDKMSRSIPTQLVGIVHHRVSVLFHFDQR
jgi:hypothetical protein